MTRPMAKEVIFLPLDLRLLPNSFFICVRNRSQHLLFVMVDHLQEQAFQRFILGQLCGAACHHQGSVLMIAILLQSFSATSRT